MEINEPIAVYGKKKFTEEEYLEFESASPEKHEYFRGEIFAMSGPKVPHSIIAVNLVSELRQKLKGRSCRPFNNDQRIYIPANTLFTYPDISIVCGKPETRNNDDWNILNPSVIVEVLSASTKQYDRGDKFAFYRQIPTLTEYILIDSSAVLVEAWRKQEDKQWYLQEYNSISDILEIKTVQVSVPLKDIYEDTDFISQTQNTL